MPDKRILISVSDGPEHIEIYTSDDEAVVDWSTNYPGLYISASLNGASFKLGPFMCERIRDGIIEALKNES